MKDRRFIFALTFVAGVAVGWLANNASAWLDVDACLDAGGAWDYAKQTCRYR